jgi:transcriptional regulator with XRE-family HTH domain
MKEQSITANIRRLRLQKKLTLQELADLTGLTKGYLSKVERSKKSPPFSTVNRIAIALETDLTFFYREKGVKAQDIRISFTRKNGGKLAEDEESRFGYRYEALAHDKGGKNMEPYIIEAAPDEEGVFQHEGEEFLYVLEGTHELTYDGKKYLMEEGDSVYFDAGVPHTGRSIGDKRTRLLAVMFNYKRL